MRWLGLVVLAACGGDPHGGVYVSHVTKNVTNDVDVLFVIEDGASDDYQSLLVQNFPNFVMTLDARPGGRPNVHMGVVSSTVGTSSDINFGTNCPKVAPNDDGLLQNTPRITGCTPPTGRFVIDDGGQSCNYGTGNCSSADLSAAFTCIAELGTAGCGFEAHLESLKRALDGSRPENAGFLRTSADLAILIFAEEDDCSWKDPSFFDAPSGNGDFRCFQYGETCDQEISTTMAGTYTNCRERTGSYLEETGFYHDFLDDLKGGDAGQLALEVLAGDPKTTQQVGAITEPFMQGINLAPSCSSTINGNPAIADSAIRLNHLVTRFPDHAIFRSICQNDYSRALEDFASLIIDVIGPCLDASIDSTDSDAMSPGLQLACNAQQAGVALPACAMTDDTHVDPASVMPCIWYEPQASTCSMRTSRIAAHVQGGSGGDYQVTCPVHQ